MAGRATARRRRGGVLAAACGVTIAVVAVPGSGPSGSTPPPRAGHGTSASAPLDLAGQYRPGEVLVGYEDHVDAAERGRLRGAYGLAKVRALRVRGTVELVRISDGTTVPDAVRALHAARGVAYAEPNYRTVDLAFPNDPRLTETWVNRNLGGASGYVLDADLDTPQAWDLGTGSTSVKIGIADSGLATAHEDIAANLWTNPGDPPGGGDQDANGYVDDTHGWDFVDDDNVPADTDGHGTLMAGVAAAVGNNGVGVAGVNWRAAIVPLRRADAATVAEAFTYAGAMGVRVVNASFALSASTAVANAIAAAPNTTFVASAGNDATSDEARSVYPCTVPSANVVCVAASDPDDTLSSFSAYGATSVDLAAPGGWGIISTDPTWDAQAYSQSFDAGWGGWTHGAISGTDRWGLHAGAGVGGTTALSDSPGTDYAASSQTWAQSPTFSLAGRQGCILRQTWKGALSGANLYFDFSADGTTWKSPGYYFGLPTAFTTVDMPTYGIEGSTTARLRYRLWTGSATADGATIDDTRVLCLGPTQTAYRTFTGGTSSAAAFVTGAIGLLLSREPALTTTQIRNRLLSSVDQRPGFTGLVASNGRLNVARLLGAPIRPDNAAAPTTTGTFARGQTVHCTDGIWAESPTSFAYRWTRDGATTPGATTPDLALGLDDGLTQVGCTVTATNGDGATSASSPARRVASPPLNLAAPVIAGDPAPGQTLTCTAGAWRYGPVSTADSWYRDGTWLATGPTLVVWEADRGHRLTCTERATNSDGSASATSGPVAVPVGPPGTTTATTTTTPTTETAASLPPLVVKIGLSSNQRLGVVLRKGLKARCSASRPGRCTVTVTITAREARRLHLRTGGLKKLTLGTRSATLPAGGRTLTIRFASRYVRALRRARTVRLTLTARVRGADDRSVTRSATVSIKR